MKNPTLINGLVDPIDGSYDSLFICCSSYEERSALGTRKLSPQYRATHSIICRASEYKDKGKSLEYYEEIMGHLTKVCLTPPQTYLFSIQDSISFVHALAKNVGELQDKNPLRAVTVDISTFPREELLLLLRYLDNNVGRGLIRLLYGEPAKYATEAKNEEDRWLTRGVKSVHPVAGFGGFQLPGRPKILVVVLGHEGERTHICIRRHQPDEIILIPQGKEQHHAGLREISDQQNQEVISLYGEKHIWPAGLPSRGVIETEQAILEIFKKYRYSHNMFVAANGTKLQLIGVYVATRVFTEIQITYAAPAVYNWESYSSGTGFLWEIMLEPPFKD